MRQIPTTLVRCDPTKDENACGLLQMAQSVPPEILYAGYWYRSGTNETMRNHLKRITSKAVAIRGKNRAHVLDIGCNDGTLLNYYPEEFVKFGIDTSDVAHEVTGDVTVLQDTFPSAQLSNAIKGK